MNRKLSLVKKTTKSTTEDTNSKKFTRVSSEKPEPSNSSFKRHNEVDKDKFAFSTNVLMNKFYIKIPTRIRNIMRTINIAFPNSEFSILVSGEFDNSSGVFVVDEKEFYIPKQSVSGASVDYDHHDDNLDFNTVIHKHPKGCRNFSSDDKKYINSNFKASVLWIDDEWVCGIINLETEIGRVQINAEIVEGEYYQDVAELAREKITDDIMVSTKVKVTDKNKKDLNSSVADEVDLFGKFDDFDGFGGF